ncbi:hypothetical protein [Candidatus Nitrosocosmicus hydrocola]|uniref:hypothetical protein n=1 Tax=Candidatus Nitrosocosmicus hydrocola TaxID=1826872 RepID=UPI0011E5C94C|nr:hypothetical protein [Candidatus Nitrosocosmicus hydrocola]
MTDKSFIGDCKRFLEFIISNGGGLDGSGVPFNSELFLIYCKKLSLSPDRLNEISEYAKSYGYVVRPTLKSTGFIIPPPSGSDIETFLKITPAGISLLNPKHENSPSLNIGKQYGGQINLNNKDSRFNNETNFNNKETRGNKSKFIEVLKSLPVISWFIKIVSGN